jgi:hypothetical protein
MVGRDQRWNQIFFRQLDSNSLLRKNNLSLKKLTATNSQAYQYSELTLFVLFLDNQIL